MKKFFLFLLFFFLITVLAAFFYREKLLQFAFYRFYGKMIETRIHTLWGNFITRGIVYTGNVIYAGTFGGLSVFDTYTSADIRLVKRLQLHGTVTTILKEKNTLYVVSQMKGIYVIDVASPFEPKVLAVVDLMGELLTKHAALENGFLYLTTNRGLIVVDVRNKTRPKIAKKILTGSLNEIFTDGKYAYVTQGGKGLAIFDIRQPDNPVKLGEVNLYRAVKGKPLPVELPPTEVVVSGDYAYVANGNNGMAVVNVKNPEKPALIKHVRTEKYCDGMTIMGDYLALKLLPDTVLFLNRHDPANPVAEKSIPGIGFPPYGINGRHAIFVKSRSSFSLVDILNPLSPETLGTYSIKTGAKAVRADDYYVYVTMGSRGLKIYRRAPPENPVFLSSIRTTGTASGMEIWKEHAFISNGFQSGIDVIDIRFPETPVLKNTFNAELMTWGLAVDKNVLYAAAWDSGLVLYGLLNPAKPAYLATADESPVHEDNPPVVSVAVRYPYAYFGDLFGRFYIADISNPAHIVFLKKISASALDIALKGNVAYLAGFEQGIHAVDISSPENAKVIADFQTDGFVSAVDVEGSRLFAADKKRGVYVFDISNPAELKSVAVFKTRGNPEDVDAVGDFCYVADGNAGLAVITVSDGQINYPDDTADTEEK